MNEDIKRDIKESGLTQRKVAAAMGIRHESLSRLLRGPISEEKRKQIYAGMAKALRELADFYARKVDL